MIIWISSYPKSGNTWMRCFLSSYIFSKNGEFTFDLLKNISGRIFLRLADGKKGWQEVSPFDAIYIDACVENSVTSLLKNQLSRFGAIVYAKSFSGQQFYCLDKNENDFKAPVSIKAFSDK